MTPEFHASGSITATTAAFTLKGGRYLFSAVATSWGTSAALATLSGDGTKYVTVPAIALGTSGAASLTADGTCLVDLPPGQYKFVVVAGGGFTALFCTVGSIPT